MDEEVDCCPRAAPLPERACGARGGSGRAEGCRDVDAGTTGGAAHLPTPPLPVLPSSSAAAATAAANQPLVADGHPARLGAMCGFL